MSAHISKRVRVFPHLDPAGQKSGNRWYSQLKRLSVHVDCFRFDGLIKQDRSPIGDLNDLAYVDADQFEGDRELWRVIP